MARMRAPRTAVALTLVAACGFGAGARADWLVYIGGAVQETSGAWQLRGRPVRFHPPSGQLQSIAIEEVDLASSAFLSVQLGSKRLAPPRPKGAPPAAGASEPPCVSGRAVRSSGAERIVVETAGRSEIVRLACLDGPEPNAGLEPIVHYVSAVERELERLLLVRPAVCYEPDAASGERDQDGRRIAYLRLADGRDLGGELIRRGFAIAAPGGCARAAEYRRIETEATANGRGLWAAASAEVARAIAAGLPRFTKPKPR